MKSRVQMFLAMVIGTLLMVAALLGLQAGAPAQAAPLQAYTTLTVTQITSSGVADTLGAAAAAGNRFSNDGQTFVEIANGSGSTITATFVTPITYMGLAVADKQVAVSAGQTKLIGPFQPSLYNQLSGSDKGMVYIDFSAVTSVTIAAWRLD